MEKRENLQSARQLVLENASGEVARVFVWPETRLSSGAAVAAAPVPTTETSAADAGSAVLIRRLDTRRIEIHADVAWLESEKIRFERLATLDRQALETAPFLLEGGGQLKLVEEVGPVVLDQASVTPANRVWYGSLLGMFVLLGGFVGFTMTRPLQTAKIEAELKQQVVQIVKKIPPRPQVKRIVPTQQTQARVAETQNVKVTSKTASIKRMGALAVLGSLSKSSQRGGVDLGAVNTTAGPGLGGTGGSGGVQQSLYGKGLVAAPVGAGGNLQGGGGYGTKGKGGGQAGYGKLSLVGSGGTMPIPLGREAIIQGGLDRDLIADVINKNLGQVRFCYEQGLQGEPSLNGRVAVAFTINGNGQVTVASIENTTLNSKAVEDCIVMRLRSWKFPLPEGGVDVKVSYPFVLRRSGQG